MVFMTRSVLAIGVPQDFHEQKTLCVSTAADYRHPVGVSGKQSDWSLPHQIDVAGDRITKARKYENAEQDGPFRAFILWRFRDPFFLGGGGRLTLVLRQDFAALSISRLVKRSIPFLLIFLPYIFLSSK
jgi:hypothetical protein